MKLIELHILQSFPVSCLNRNDVGSPKTASFGGVTRGRISSQCFKRAIRELARGMDRDFVKQAKQSHQDELPVLFEGVRTRRAADDLTRALATAPHKLAEIEARNIADAVCEGFLSKPKKAEAEPAKATKTKKSPKSAAAEAEGEAEEETSTLLYFSPGEIALMATAIAKAKKEGKTNFQYAAASALADEALGDKKPKDLCDIAIFGRMVSNEPKLTLEGAGLFNHPLTTHKATNEWDFWTAVDDNKEAGKRTGAANMGTSEFTAGVFYRYIGLNLDLLFDDKHLGFIAQPKLRQRIVNTFLKAVLQAIPSARRNASNADCEVGYALGLYREKGQPLQLVNAFENPMRAFNGLLMPSIRALLLHYGDLRDYLGSGLSGLELATGSRRIGPDKQADNDGRKLEAVPKRVGLEDFCDQLAQKVPAPTKATKAGS